ncbi:MAG: hypothetical protein ACK5P7_04815 [Bdellovibrio sp.]
MTTLQDLSSNHNAALRLRLKSRSWMLLILCAVFCFGAGLLAGETYRARSAAPITAVGESK